MIRRIRGDKEKSVYSSISTPNRTKAELHNKKEGTEGSAPRGDKGGQGKSVYQYRHQTGWRRSSIRKKNARREALQGGIRGIREDKEEKGDKGGIRVIRRIRGDKEISVYS